MKKMNAMLAVVEQSASQCTKNLKELATCFKRDTGDFLGVKKTYTAREGYADDPSKRGYKRVVSTVDEMIESLQKELTAHLTDLFTIERTNSIGAAKVPLVVEGHDFGNLTAIELMRLKSFLMREEFEQIYNAIPVRSDAEDWTRTTDSDYEGREIWETPLIKGVAKTSENEEVILKDPNLNPESLPANYVAKTTVKRKTVEVGDYTSQTFSGEWNLRQRSELLRRRAALFKAVIEALKVVNDVETVASDIQVESLLNYIHYGK